MSAELVAELGINHGGDRELAARLAQEAQQAGAGAVKLQLYDAQELCAIRGDYTKLNQLRSSQLSVQDLEYVRDRVRVPVYASVFNAGLVDCYAAAGFTRVKLAAREFEHQPALVQTIGADTRFNRVEFSVTPAMMDSEGLSERCSCLRLPGRCVFALHCIPAYPVVQAEQWELRRLLQLLAHTQRPGHHIGLSGHCRDLGMLSVVLPMAVALGCSLVELHFRGSLRAAECPEAQWSLAANEFRSCRYYLDIARLIVGRNAHE